MQAKIKTVFQDRPEQPLFYVESGSRLWGIASPDSDFDVRGFHLQSKQQQFDFKKQRDLIEIMEGDFDFVSYELDKMFGLLAKSNPTVLEWIRAHLVYLNELPDWANFQAAVIENYDFKALFHHYLSMAKGAIHLMESEKKFTYKVVFYCIRGLLSAALASKEVLPALLIDNLFKQFEQPFPILDIAQNSLEKKKNSLEKTSIAEEEKTFILQEIKSYADVLTGQAPGKTNDRNHLEAILRDYAYELKSSCYNCTSLANT